MWQWKVPVCSGNRFTMCSKATLSYSSSMLSISKRSPSRKTDQKDAEWIADLLRHGLLRASFVPSAQEREVREFTRHRTKLSQERSRVINRVQKVLEDANIKLAAVASDVMGKSAHAMLQALLQDDVDPATLAELALGKMRAKRDLLEQALTGLLKEQHRFLIREHLEHIKTLDQAIVRASHEIAERLRPFEAQLTRLETIIGIKRRLAEIILAELGTDMGRFPSSRHLARLRRNVSWESPKRRQAFQRQDPQGESLVTDSLGRGCSCGCSQ